jgi:hypothetical protein
MMISDVVVASEEAFTLEGHDCPLGEYPSVLVPVGKLGSRRVVAYSGDAEVEFEPIAETARFHRHDEVTARSLEGFNPRKQGIFGINSKDILIYDLGSEQQFYRRLLRSSAAFLIEPFYRLSLAFETNDSRLIRPLYIRCAEQLRRQSPELFAPLLSSLPAATPIIAQIQREVLRAVEGPRVSPPHAELWQIAGSAAARIPSDPISVAAGPAMTASRIREAVRAMARREGVGSIGWTSLHSLALRASLTFSPSSQISDSAVFPSAAEVAQRSELSLPHLEFENIILSRSTAVEFLERSRVGISRTVLLQDVLTERFYKQQFARPAPKVRRRLMFTYSEVLAMVKYTGTVELA